MSDPSFEAVSSKLESGAVATTKIQAGDIQTGMLPDPTPEILDFIVRYWAMRQAAEQQ